MSFEVSRSLGTNHNAFIPSPCGRSDHARKVRLMVKKVAAKPRDEGESGIAL
jgi:hypothetical protein